MKHVPSDNVESFSSQKVRVTPYDLERKVSAQRQLNDVGPTADVGYGIRPPARVGVRTVQRRQLALASEAHPGDRSVVGWWE